MIVTLEQLKAADACADQVRLFKQLFGTSVTLTPDLCRKHAQDFDAEWAARNLLPPDAHAAYEVARAKAQAAYKAASAKPHAAYKAATAKAQAAYEAAMAETYAAYLATTAEAWAAYKMAKAEAFASAAGLSEETQRATRTTNGWWRWRGRCSRDRDG